MALLYPYPVNVGRVEGLMDLQKVHRGMLSGFSLWFRVVLLSAGLVEERDGRSEVRAG